MRPATKNEAIKTIRAMICRRLKIDKGYTPEMLRHPSMQITVNLMAHEIYEKRTEDVMVLEDNRDGEKAEHSKANY